MSGASGSSSPACRAPVAGDRAARWIALAERVALVVALLATVAVFGALLPNVFLTWANLTTILGSQAVLVVVTLGLLCPLIAGDFDLSVAQVLTLSSMAIAVLNVGMGWPIWAAVLAALAIGLLVGFANGFFVVVFNIHSLIVTLGIGTILHGITLWISGSRTISGVSFGLVDLVIVGRLFGIPYAFYYAMGICFLMWYGLRYTAVGRRLLFVGRGREVARLSGISVGRMRWGALVLSSLLGAVAGVMYTGTTGAADPTSGLSLLLPAFAAAFLGATSIEPGRFNPWGATLAVYFLVTGITGLTMLGIQTYVQELFYGGALIVAVVLSQLVRGRREMM